jgi:hypothetical protein
VRLREGAVRPDVADEGQRLPHGLLPTCVSQ